MGTDPLSPDFWSIALIDITESSYVFRFPVSANSLGMAVGAEMTNDLINWQSGDGIADILGYLPDESGGYYLVVEIPRPDDPSIPVFARLIFQLPGN